MYKLLISACLILYGATLSTSLLATTVLQLSAPQNDRLAQSALMPSQNQPSQDKQDTALRQLRTKLARFAQFSARFDQKVFDASGQEIQVSQGEMQVKQPNLFRWKTYQPDESLIVSDGQSVWIYNSFVEQVTAMQLDKTVQQSPLWLIANQSDDAWLQFSVSHDQQGYFIVPNDPNSLTKQITIRFNDDSISQLVIEDSQGQSSEFNLKQFNSTPSFDRKLFIFEMPSGVDFDDQREAN